MTNKMLVVGLDGACWSLIDEWIEEGILPNIKNLKEKGAWGKMRSCAPPITSPAWQCYATGKNPGKLGVFWWEHLDLENREVETPNSKTFKGKRVWDYLNFSDHNTGVIGMPTTFPPSQIDGFMVTGGPDTSFEDYTYPKEIQTIIEDEFDYQPHCNLSISDEDKKDEAIEEAHDLISKNFEVGNFLKEKFPVDFLQITTFQVNGPFQHFFFKDEPTKKAWKIIDEKIGELMDDFEYVVLLSDHGTSPMIKNFYLNAWLQQEGYLKKKKTKYDYLYELGINRDLLENILRKLNLLDFLGRFKFVKQAGKQLPNKSGRLQERAGKGTLSRIVWDETKVVASPQGPIYINKDLIDSEEEYEQLRSELIEKLSKLKDPENDKNMFQSVERKEDIYEGEFLDKAPDLVAIDADEYHNKGGIDKDALMEESRWKGNNALKGLFLFSGPGIRENEKIEGVNIFDLVPTILHIFDTPIPDDLDGKILKEIFTENYLQDKEIEKVNQDYFDKKNEQKKIQDAIDGVEL